MSVFIYFFITPSLLSENVVAMSFFCNTHYVGPVPFSRDWIWNCCCCRRGLLWASERVSFPPSPSPTLLAEWMNDTFGPGSDWCLVMMMVVVVILVSMNVKSPPVPEKSSQEQNQEFWGWWGRSPDLSQWTSSKSKMYRTRIFLCLFSVWEMRFFFNYYLFILFFLFIYLLKGR